MKKICFATNNKGKLEEVKLLLKGKYEIVSLKDIGCNEELPENGHTIAENAFEKAKYVCKNYKMPCFADDSGLEIDFLNGKPGVDSAHFSGARNDIENMNLVLEKLKYTENRIANFKTVICYCSDIFTNISFEGKIFGEITFDKKGQNGFGYDPIFVPNGFSKTFAEMTKEEKNTISHRAIAVKKLIKYLEQNNL